MINYQSHGYGKFILDEDSITAFETGLSKFDCSLSRKQVYNILFDMTKSGYLAGSRVMSLISNNLSAETAEDVIADCLRFIVPATINKYLPVEVYDKYNAQMFTAVIQLLASGNFNQPSTQQLLLSSVLGFAQGETQRNLVYKWFLLGKISDESGKEISGIDISIEHRHNMVKKIFGSRSIEHSAKKECFAKLAKLDQSDKLSLTQTFCEAVVPTAETKREVWKRLFGGKETLSLDAMENLCYGFKQLTQRELLTEFAEDFFERIEEVVNTKAVSVARYYYFLLQPNMRADADEIALFE